MRAIEQRSQTRTEAKSLDGETRAGRRDEGRRLDPTDGWVFLTGGALAAISVPILIQLAGSADPLLIALSFGALVGACDAARADNNMEAATRVSVGIALGLMVATALIFSPIAAGLAMGLGVVISRWIWTSKESRNLPIVPVAIVIAALPLWVFPVLLNGGSSGQLLESAPLLLWGLGAGLSAVILQLPGYLEGKETAKVEALSAITDDRQGRRLAGDDGPLAALVDDLLGALEGAGDECLREAVTNAVEAWSELAAQRELIGRYSPDVRRRQIEGRKERLMAFDSDDDVGEGDSELAAALRELEDELEQCQKLDRLSRSLGVRQERIRSALERLRLDLLHRRCDGLYESRVSNRLDSLNELVASSTFEREVMTELLLDDS